MLPIWHSAQVRPRLALLLSMRPQSSSPGAMQPRRIWLPRGKEGQSNSHQRNEAGTVYLRAAGLAAVGLGSSARGQAPPDRGAMSAPRPTRGAPIPGASSTANRSAQISRPASPGSIKGTCSTTTATARRCSCGGAVNARNPGACSRSASAHSATTTPPARLRSRPQTEHRSVSRMRMLGVCSAAPRWTGIGAATALQCCA